MKKILLALMVCALTLTFAFTFTSFKASAATDGFTWLDTYESQEGLLEMYLRKDRTKFTTYGYSGTDVNLGNKWLYTVARGNVLIPGENMSVPTPSWGSFGQLYYNNSTQDWYIPRTTEAAFIMLFIDENGQVYQIDNGNTQYDLGACVPATGTEPIIPGNPVTDCKQSTGDVQLRYLDSSLEKTLDKAEIDLNKADGITFVEGDLVFKNADGKYTNVATDNTAVIKQQQAVFAANDPLVTDGTVTAGDLKYQYTETEVVKFTNQPTKEGFTVTPVMENVKGVTWTNEGATATTNLDADYDADANGAFGFTVFVAQKAITTYDVWWDETTNTKKFRATTPVGSSVSNKHLPHESVQLTYADLNGGTNSSYYWLTKAFIDGKTAENITFVDTDLLYKDADNKYTNVAEGNTPVMNDDLGFVVPVGHKVLAFEYLDRVDWNTDAYLKSFHTLVNGVDGTATITEHDVTAPSFLKTDGKLPDFLIAANSPVKVAQGTNPEFVVPSNDFGLMTVLGDESQPTITTKYFEFNPETQLYDIEVDRLVYDTINKMYKVTYEAADTTGNVAKSSFTIKVVAAYAPVFAGLTSKSVNEGVAIDLLAGVTATDGYGNDITSQIKVLKGSLNTAKPLPGTYEVLYYAINTYNAVAFQSITITVLDTTEPGVYPIPDIKILEGTTFDLTSPVNAYDNIYNDVFDIVVIDDDDFDKDEPGIYTIELEVYDLAGNVTEVSYKLEVIAAGQDVASLITALQTALADANLSITDKQTKIDNLLAQIAALQTALDNKDGELDDKDEELAQKYDELLKKYNDLNKTSTDNNQTNVILTAVVALVAIGGASLGATSLFKRH